jgi:hypothetical protein
MQISFKLPVCSLEGPKLKPQRLEVRELEEIKQSALADSCPLPSLQDSSKETISFKLQIGKNQLSPNYHSPSQGSEVYPGMLHNRSSSTINLSTNNNKMHLKRSFFTGLSSISLLIKSTTAIDPILLKLI